MKKIISLLSLALFTLSCSQAQQTEFSNEALENEMVDIENTSIAFNDILKKYEGKTIVIDVWASWCSDCIKGMPKLKELQAKFPDATYLFISMDKNHEAWRKGIAKYDVQGEHYLTNDGMNGVFGKSVKLNWIPRYMIVDKTGKIALFKAIEADDEKITETLNALK